jgi:hypothetical protein
LGLQNVEYDAELIRSYPAAVVTPGRKGKAVHGTHQFELAIEATITVYHARLAASRLQRTREDLQLCLDIEAKVEEDLNWTNDFNEPRVIFAFVSEVLPGTITRPKGDQVIGTRMVVTVQNLRRFK